MPRRQTLFVYVSGLSAGQMEHLLEREGGALAERLQDAVSGPLSFPLQDKAAATLTSIMTGLWPDQHGVLLPQIHDSEAGTFRAASGHDRQRPTFWERLALEGQSVVSVGWPYALPTQAGNHVEVIDAAFGSSEISLPSAVFRDAVSGKGAESLFEAWVRPHELPTEVLQALVPRIAEKAAYKGNRFGQLAAALAENISRQVAFVELIQSVDWKVGTLHLSLPAQLARLAAQSEGDDAFAEVETQVLVVLEEMLLAILASMSTETNLIFASLPMGANPLSKGKVLFHGPDFQPGQTCGASALDLAPTIWSLAGFTELKYPGRALLEILRPEALAGSRYFRAKWSPSAGPAPTAAELASLDLLNPPGINPRAFFTNEQLLAWKAEWNLTLFRSFVSHSAYLEALPIVERQVRDYPNQTEMIKVLAEILLRAELFEEALEVALDAVDATPPDDPDPLLLLASAYAALGDRAKALELLAEVEALSGDVANKLRVVQIYEYFKEWGTVLSLIERDSEKLPEERRCLAAARAHLALEHWEEARDEALQVVSVNYANPFAHELFAQALWKLNERAAALAAFSTCACLLPNRAWPFERLVHYGTLAGCATSDIEQWQLQQVFAQEHEHKLIADYRKDVAQYRQQQDDPMPISAPRQPQVASEALHVIGVIGLPGGGQ
ncbi:alkaline phosphatase family protein, partial [Cerasicoccus arenae]